MQQPLGEVRELSWQLDAACSSAVCVKQIDDHLLDTEFHRPMTSNDFVTNDVSDCEKKVFVV